MTYFEANGALSLFARRSVDWCVCERHRDWLENSKCVQATSPGKLKVKIFQKC